MIYVPRYVVVTHVCLVKQCLNRIITLVFFFFFTLVAKIKAKKRIPIIIIFSPSVRTTSPKGTPGMWLCRHPLIHATNSRS